MLNREAKCRPFSQGVVGTLLLLMIVVGASGRKLNFNMASANGYFDQVDATLLGSDSPAVRTKLVYDGGGHLTRLQVCDGASGTPIRTDDFGYDGDAVNYTAQNGVITRTAFVASPVKDPWFNDIKRVQSQTVGDSADTSSSDDGQSVQGTYTYSYGAINTARTQANYGVDGHTNRVTDPRGNTTTSID